MLASVIQATVTPSTGSTWWGGRGLDGVMLHGQRAVPCHYSYSRACGLYCFDARVEFFCMQRLCIWDRRAQTWHARSWHPHCRGSFRNEIWKLLFSRPEFDVFINGPMVKGFAEPGPVFQNCHSLVGADASGHWKGSTIMSVLPHCEWCVLPAENMLS